MKVIIIEDYKQHHRYVSGIFKHLYSADIKSFFLAKDFYDNIETIKSADLIMLDTSLYNDLNIDLNIEVGMYFYSTIRKINRDIPIIIMSHLDDHYIKIRNIHNVDKNTRVLIKHKTNTKSIERFLKELEIISENY